MPNRYVLYRVELGVDSYEWDTFEILNKEYKTCEKKSFFRFIYRVYGILTYERILGIERVGIVVTIWPHSSVPIPKNMHHIHCSRVRAFVLNAILPYWMMTT